VAIPGIGKGLQYFRGDLATHIRAEHVQIRECLANVVGGQGR
jgi:hypothetical protein